MITPVANNHHNTYADDFFASRLTGARSVLMAKLVRMGVCRSETGAAFDAR